MGPLAFMGIGTTASHFAHIAFAESGSTALYFRIIRKVLNFSSDRVIAIPKFINTPMDLLAISLFDLMAPVLLKMCQVEGVVSGSEIEFVEDWGYNRGCFKLCLPIINDQIVGQQIKDLLLPHLEDIEENPGCNQVEIANDILPILKEVAEINGQLHPG